MENQQVQDEIKLQQFYDERAKEIGKEFSKMADIGSSSERVIKLNNPFSMKNSSYMGTFNNFTNENIATWLSSPLQYEQQLRHLSNLLYSVSGEYKSLIRYYSDMARFYSVVELNETPDDYSPKQLREQMSEITRLIRKYNLSHEKAKIWNTVLKEDVYYGYEIEDDLSFFFLKLNPDFCRLSGYSDGMWLFEFDFSYFDSSHRNALLDSYPKEFKLKYRRYRDKSTERRWQQLDPKKAVVYKFNETDQEIVPPLSSTFEGLMELKEYKKLKKVGAKIDNYMILHQKVPLFRDTDKNMKQNNFMIDTQTAMSFHNLVSSSLPDEIGAVISPMDITPISLDKKHNPSDKVQEATRDVYNAAGVNQNLFNPEKNSTAGLSRSIKKDEMLVINFYLQVERWLNRKLTLEFPKYEHWDINLVKTTGLSEDDYSEFLIKIGSLGYPVVGSLGAILGHDITKIEALTYLENDVLKIKEKLIPFASTHTGGLIDKGGGQVKDDDELTDSGIASRESSSGQGGEE